MDGFLEAGIRQTRTILAKRSSSQPALQRGRRCACLLTSSRGHGPVSLSIGLEHVPGPLSACRFRFHDQVGSHRRVGTTSVRESLFEQVGVGGSEKAEADSLPAAAGEEQMGTAPPRRNMLKEQRA